MNNYLQPPPKGREKKPGENGKKFFERISREEKTRKAREDELADYSHKFWSYFSSFDAYHSGTAHFKDFKDEVAFFYDRPIRGDQGAIEKH